MGSNFLKAYLGIFPSTEGAFQFDAALLFMAYNQLINSQGVSGDVLEIGVHHGLSAIAVASLRGNGKRFFAVDLFEDLQLQNTSDSGSGDKAVFVSNIKAFYENIDFLNLITSNSANLRPDDLGSGFSFCHIDGGHSDNETYHDLCLCYQILVPGGLVALDDYFNPTYPGVCEGAIGFMLDHREALLPIAIGFNKVLFQKSPSPFNLNAMFSRVFSNIPKVTAVLWGTPVHLFWSSFLYFFNLSLSTPGHLVPSSSPDARATFEPQITNLNAKPGQIIHLPVRVTNKSTISFQHGDGTCGLSYHLLSSSGVTLRYDNARNFFKRALKPGEEVVMDLLIQAPDETGRYLVEIDIVWEGVMWFKDKGNPASIVDLTVT